MFARSVFRCARAGAPVKQPVRRYATEGGSSGGSFITPIAWSAIGVGVIGGGAYYYTNWMGRQMEKADSAPSEPQFKGGEQGFLSLKLENVEPLSHNTKKFRFSFDDPNMTSGLPVASAVVTKYQGPEMEKPVIRPYTPTSDVVEDQKGSVDFVIKKYPNGPMSTHMHDMAPGQRLDIKGPIVKYPIDQPNKHNHIAMISGGTGITPMYQVIRQLFKDPNDKTKVTLVFGNISEDDILLKKELHELENTYPQRFRAFYTLDKPPEGWTQGKGFITKDLLKTVLPEPKEDNIKIFVCGPPGLYKAVSGGKNSPTDQGELTGALADLGYGKDQVFKF